MHLTDISDEFQLRRFRNGFYLAKSNQKIYNETYGTGRTILDLMKLPFCIYFVDRACALQKTNEATAELFDFDSPRSAINLTAYDFLDRKSAAFAQQTDKQVMDKRVISVFEHDVNIIDNNSYNQFTVKAPLYENDHVIGLVGFSVALGRHSLSIALPYLAEMNLLLIDKSNIDNNTKNTTLFTGRERELLPLLIKGKTAREIAEKLFISKRTVENHIDHIKQKLSCKKKSALIDAISELRF